MKLRLLDNSIRVRVSVDEVRTLTEGNAVNAGLSLPQSKAFRYQLGLSTSASAMATFDGETLRIGAPADDLKRWGSTDEVSLVYSISGDSATMTVRIEKDFQCLAPREGEDESTLFANPKSSSMGGRSG